MIGNEVGVVMIGNEVAVRADSLSPGVYCINCDNGVHCQSTNIVDGDGNRHFIVARGPDTGKGSLNAPYTMFTVVPGVKYVQG